MTGDQVVQEILEYVRRNADGADDPWLRGYAAGQIAVATAYMRADAARAAACVLCAAAGAVAVLLLQLVWGAA